MPKLVGQKPFSTLDGSSKKKHVRLFAKTFLNALCVCVPQLCYYMQYAIICICVCMLVYPLPGQKSKVFT